MEKNRSKTPKEEKDLTYKVLHEAFQIGIILKGLNGFVETVAGVLLLVISSATIQGWIHGFLSPFIAKNPDSWWVNGAQEFVGKMNPGTQAFVAWYFVSHGVVKFFVVICLMFRWMWAYPLGIVVLAAFMAYQTFEYIWGSHSWFYVFLNVLDAALIFLTINEWNHAKKMKALHANLVMAEEKA